LWLRDYSLTLGQHRPETVVVVPAVREAAQAARRPAVPGAVVPEAAANDAGRARSRPLRIDDTPGGVRAKPVLTPLHHVPEHVIQSPGIRRITPNWSSHSEVDSARIIDGARRAIIFELALEV